MNLLKKSNFRHQSSPGMLRANYSGLKWHHRSGLGSCRHMVTTVTTQIRFDGSTFFLFVKRREKHRQWVHCFVIPRQPTNPTFPSIYFTPNFMFLQAHTNSASCAQSYQSSCSLAPVHSTDIDKRRRMAVLAAGLAAPSQKWSERTFRNTRSDSWGF